MTDASAPSGATDISGQVGARIRALRLARGLSQERLALLSDIHRAYLGGIERGERNPALKNLAAIAAALGVAPRDLLPPYDAAPEPRPQRRPRKLMVTAARDDGQ